jgi:hypothetical protein
MKKLLKSLTLIYILTTAISSSQYIVNESTTFKETSSESLLQDDLIGGKH